MTSTARLGRKGSGGHGLPRAVFDSALPVARNSSFAWNRSV